MKSNKIIFPVIAGILLGLFSFDLIFGIKLLNLKAFAITSAFFITITLLIWYSYSKITKNSLEKDALTFIPFVILILFPLRYLINIPENLQKGANLPSLLLLLISLSLFIGLKSFFFEKKLKSRIKINYKKILFLVVISYILIFSVLAALKHMSFNSTAYDLGLYDQTIWGYSKGKMLFNTIREINLLGDHVHPILFLIAPLYWIYPHVTMILTLQTICLALGAVPLFLIAKKHLNEKAALLIALSYLFYPSLQYANLFDFHPITIAVPFLFLAVYSLDEKKYRLMFASLFIAGLTKEYIPIFFITFGAYLFFIRKKKSIGIAGAIIGLLWLYINMKVIIPTFSEEGYLYIKGTTYFALIKSKILSIEGIKFLVTNKIPYFALLFMPFGLGIFSFIGFPILMLAILNFVILTFFQPIGLQGIIYHHPLELMPFIATASIFGIKKCSKKIKKVAPLFILTTSILAFVFYGPFTILYDLSEFNPSSEYVRNGEYILSQIPKNASVVAPHWIIPHLSHREKVYTAKHFLSNTTFMQKSPPPEYIVFDLSKALIDPKRSARKIKEVHLNYLFSNKDYGIIDSKGTWLLLKLGTNYEEGICKLKPFLNKEDYPYLNISIKEKELIEKC